MNKLFLPSMIFILALSLVVVIGALADDGSVVTDMEYGGDIGIDALKFIEPYQYTSKNIIVYQPKPAKGFKAGVDPLWMNFFVNVDTAKEVTAIYILINPKTGQKKKYKSVFELPEGGDYRLSLGWPDGAPDDLKGVWVLVGAVFSGQEKDICKKFWPFIVM